MEPQWQKRHYFINQYKNKIKTSHFADDQVVTADLEDK